MFWENLFKKIITFSSLRGKKKVKTCLGSLEFFLKILFPFYQMTRLAVDMYSRTLSSHRLLTGLINKVYEQRFRHTSVASKFSG